MTLAHAAGALLRSRRLHVAVLAAVLALWVLRAVTIYRDPTIGGIFRWIGVDFGTYYIQASAFAAGSFEALFSLAALEPFRHALAAYTSDPGTPLPPQLTPYPPLFAALLSPLTRLSPPLAFALWTALNVVLALGLAWRVATLFPARRRLVAAMLVLVCLPLAYSVWLGNVQIFLALAVGEAFLALRSGRDLRAGIWLSALVIKPQYMVLLGPVLVWKRRWKALVGFAAGTGLILGASALLAGPSSLVAYFGSVLEIGGLSGGAIQPDVFAEHMVNWRALVLAVPGGLDSGLSLAITLILSGLTVVAVLPAWRGPWATTSPRFGGQVTLLLLATILALYYSQPYGPLLLVLPLATHLASSVPSGAWARPLDIGTRFAVGAAILAPTIWFVLGRTTVRSINLLTLALVAIAVLLLPRLLLGGRPPEGGGKEVEEEQSPARPRDEPGAYPRTSSRAPPSVPGAHSAIRSQDRSTTSS